jgi:hypothetical protein
MQPDLEIVEVRGDESFTAWAHGYPYRTVRWHFHPEYEIQLIVETKGVYFVGDHVGHFEPGNLVLMGPTCRTTGSATCPRARASSGAAS